MHFINLHHCRRWIVTAIEWRLWKTIRVTQVIKKPQIKKDFINNMETKFLNTFTIYIYAHVLYSTSYQFYVEINEKKIKRT